jgi:hypothetical protein
MGDGNERTGDEATSCRERSETIDGRRNPSDGKGSGSRGEDSLQDPDRHHENRMHDFVVAIMIWGGRSALGMVRIAGLAQERLSQRMPEGVGPFSQFARSDGD